MSYHHTNDDEKYRLLFDLIMSGKIISKSVQYGEISSDNSDQYIKRLIQTGHITTSSVVVVLIGLETYKRKHVDWEISAAINKKVGGYCGLIGLLLPHHPSFTTETYDGSLVPPRLVDNNATGYAKIYNWTNDTEILKGRIEEAFNARINRCNLIDNSRPQFAYNR